MTEQLDIDAERLMIMKDHYFSGTNRWEKDCSAARFLADDINDTSINDKLDAWNSLRNLNIRLSQETGFGFFPNDFFGFDDQDYMPIQFAANCEHLQLIANILYQNGRRLDAEHFAQVVKVSDCSGGEGCTVSEEGETTFDIIMHSIRDRSGNVSTDKGLSIFHPELLDVSTRATISSALKQIQDGYERKKTFVKMVNLLGENPEAVAKIGSRLRGINEWGLPQTFAQTPLVMDQSASGLKLEAT